MLEYFDSYAENDLSLDATLNAASKTILGGYVEDILGRVPLKWAEEQDHYYQWNDHYRDVQWVQPHGVSRAVIKSDGTADMSNNITGVSQAGEGFPWEQSNNWGGGPKIPSTYKSKLPHGVGTRIDRSNGEYMQLNFGTATNYNDTINQFHTGFYDEDSADSTRYAVTSRHTGLKAITGQWYHHSSNASMSVPTASQITTPNRRFMAAIHGDSSVSGDRVYDYRYHNTGATSTYIGYKIGGAHTWGSGDNYYSRIGWDAGSSFDGIAFYLASGRVTNGVSASTINGRVARTYRMPLALAGEPDPYDLPTLLFFFVDAPTTAPASRGKVLLQVMASGWG